MTQRNVAEEKIAEHQDDLGALADSDLPVSWIAEALMRVGSSSTASATREGSQ